MTRLVALQDFKAYTAPSLDLLSDKVAKKESVWCGWHNFLGQHSCVARLSPFGPVHVGVSHNGPPCKPVHPNLHLVSSMRCPAQCLDAMPVEGPRRSIDKFQNGVLSMSQHGSKMS